MDCGTVTKAYVSCWLGHARLTRSPGDRLPRRHLGQMAAPFDTQAQDNGVLDGVMEVLLQAVHCTRPGMITRRGISGTDRTCFTLRHVHRLARQRTLCGSATPTAGRIEGRPLKGVSIKKTPPLQKNTPVFLLHFSYYRLRA
jgi:hypothetical protein